MLPHLHAITNDQILALTDLGSRAESITAVGAVALHVRGRSTPTSRLVTVGRQLREAGGILFVNDRVDVAAHLGCQGIHLPSEGLSIHTARQLLGDKALIGRSTHSPEDARRTWDDGADYVFLGPIWETVSHPGQPAIGPRAIKAALPARVIAIGGVTPERVPECVEAGAYGVAAITALWNAPDPAAAASRMLLCFGES